MSSHSSLAPRKTIDKKAKARALAKVKKSSGESKTIFKDGDRVTCRKWIAGRGWLNDEKLTGTVVMQYWTGAGGYPGTLLADNFYGVLMDTVKPGDWRVRVFSAPELTRL